MGRKVIGVRDRIAQQLGMLLLGNIEAVARIEQLEAEAAARAQAAGGPTAAELPHGAGTALKPLAPVDLAAAQPPAAGGIK